jgi:hypothetical protein
MIRHMTAKDADDIVLLVIAAGMFSAEEAEVVRGLLRDHVEARQDGHVCVVDEHDERLVGVAYYQPNGPVDRLWDLTMIAVHPETFKAPVEVVRSCATWRKTCGRVARDC